MIQRKQSIWFLFACLSLVATYFFPIGSKDIAQTHFSISTVGIIQETAGKSSQILDFLIIGIGFLGIAALLLINILVYKNRKLQKSIAYFGILFIIILYFAISYESQSLPGGLSGLKFSIGAFLPCLAIFFVILGIKGINKDIKLLKSADRLR